MSRWIACVRVTPVTPAVKMQSILFRYRKKHMLICVNVSSYSHLDAVGGLRVGQRPVQQAAAAHRFGLAVKGRRRGAGRQTNRAQ